MGWLAREAQLRAALEAPVEVLDDERALNPAVTNWRGLTVGEIRPAFDIDLSAVLKP